MKCFKIFKVVAVLCVASSTTVLAESLPSVPLGTSMLMLGGATPLAVVSVSKDTLSITDEISTAALSSAKGIMARSKSAAYAVHVRDIPLSGSREKERNDALVNSRSQPKEFCHLTDNRILHVGKCNQ